MKFLIDAQLPPQLAYLLKALGHEALHVQDINLLNSSDDKIWNYAVKENLIEISMYCSEQ